MTVHDPQAPADQSPPLRACPSSLSWRAIFAGTLAGLSLEMLLIVLGVAIGLVAIQDGAGWGMAVGTGIWLVLSSCIALFFGGLVAGWTGRCSCTGDGLLQGFLVWCLVTALSTMLMIGIVGRVLRGAGAVAAGAGKAVASTSRAVGAAAKNLIPDGDLADVPWQDLEGDVKRAIEAYAPDAVEGDEGKGRVRVLELIRVFLADEDQATHEARRQRLRGTLRQELGLSEEKADQLLGEVQDLYDQMDERVRQAWHQVREQAMDVARSAASAGAQAAWWLFFCLLLGAACGSLGGLLGVHVLRSERIH